MADIIKISSKVNIYKFLPIKILYRNRSLIYSMALREFSSRHKNMFVGILWIIIQPVAMAILFSIIMGKGVTENYGANFLSILIGWGAWQSLSRFLGDGAMVLHANIGLITKVYFKRLVVIIAKMTAILFDMALLFIPILIILALVELIWHLPTIHMFGLNFLYFIWATIWLTVLGIGLSAFFSVITIKFKDVGQVLGLLSMIWMFSSPIWTKRIDMLPEKYRFIATYNPAYSILSFFRHGILNTPLIAPHDMYIQIIITVVVFFVGLFVFNLLERSVVEEI